MPRKPIVRAGSNRGFTLLEIMVALVVFALVGVAIFQILVHTNQSEDVGQSLTEAQQNARAALDTILRDLRQAGYNIDSSKNVPIETASQYRMTFVIDQNQNGTIDPGERITYFLDADQSDPAVANTPNPHDYVIRRIISTAADSMAAPAAGTGDIVAYGVTQRPAGGDGWGVPLFDYYAGNGTSLLGGGADPDDAVYGRTVADSLLGAPAGTGYDSQVRTVRVQVVAEAGRIDPESHDYQQVRVSGTIYPRNLGIVSLAGYATTVTGTGTGSGTGVDTTGTGEPGTGTSTGTNTTLPPQEPAIHIPTERVLSMAVADFHEADSQEGSNVTVDHQHDYDIVVGTQTSGTNNLAVWFEGYPDRYSGDRLYNSVPNYTGHSTYDINDMTVANIDAGEWKYQDVVAAVSSSDVTGGFEVWLNQGIAQEGWVGTGSPTTAGNAFYTNSSGKGTAVAIADMNNDGIPDVVLGTRTGTAAGRIEIWTNDGIGVFTQRRVLTADGEVNSLVCADFDGDGWSDIAAGTTTNSQGRAGSVDVWINKTLYNFTELGPWTSGGSVRDLAAGPMDANTSIDLVAGTQTNNTKGKIELWLNAGNGTMTLSDQATADNAVLSVALGPIDYGNTSLDIVAGTAAKSVQVWFCDRSAASPSGIIPANESWADRNTGGVVNAVAVQKIEASRDHPEYDPLYDIVCGTAVNSTSGEIVIYLNPYVWTLTP